MSLVLFALGASFLLLLWRLRWRRTARALGLAWVAVFWLLGNGIATRWITNSLQAGYAAPTRIAWQPDAVIVLLGMGMQRLPQEGGVEPQSLAYSRILRTAQLYDACVAATRGCTVVVSGGDPAGLGRTEAELYSALLVEVGVPRAAIIEEERSRTTWENARDTTDLLARRPHGPVVLVTSGLHMRRAVLYFRHFGLRPLPARSDYAAPFPSWLPSSYNLLVCDLALVEWLGIARYHLYKHLGWNGSAAAPPAVVPP